MCGSCIFLPASFILRLFIQTLDHLRQSLLLKANAITGDGAGRLAPVSTGPIHLPDALPISHGPCVLRCLGLFQSLGHVLIKAL